MVLLTMTTSMVEALEKIQSLGIGPTPDRHVASKDETNVGETAAKNDSAERSPDSQAGFSENTNASISKEPMLENPRIGNPILHGQVVDLSKQMKEQELEPCRLEVLLKGSRIYVPPPPTKPEPTSEYKALMARLRREEEARTYERMTNPVPAAETFAQRFPMASAAHAFPSSYQSIETSDPDDDGTTYADVDRQITLIFNVLISIVACAAGIWITARWWSTPMRLALSMGGSLLVGVAEVVVYAGYIRRVGEAKTQEKKLKEVKQVVNTWVVGAEEKKPEEEEHIILTSKADAENVQARRRKKDSS